jgi:serine/threonine-protein kinase HipA
MNRCYSCGKKINAENILIHPKCLKRLFNTNFLPSNDFRLDDLSIRAQEMAGKLSISGVQAKLSVKINSKKKKIEIVSEKGEYILKPQINEFPNIPENENLCMNIAEDLGVTVPPRSLIKLKDDTFAYIVKRFDRINNKKRHQEDFAQILGLENKYSGSMEKIAKQLKDRSAVPGLDLQLFFERMLLFFIIGNGDAHLKNYSVVYDNLDNIRLSPAYDIVSSKLVIPTDDDFAIPMNGKKNAISRKDFDDFAKSLNIRTTVSYKKILKKEPILELIKHSFLPSEQKKKLSKIVEDRFSRLRE